MHANSPEFSKLADPALHRSRFMISDLRYLVGEDWHSELSILPIAGRYAKRVADLAVSDPALLVGHIYARYLGDLSGGPILKRVLRRSLDLPDRALSFYEFPAISDLEKFRSSYIQAIRDLTEDWPLIDRIAQEAEKAFQFNIDLSEDLLSFSRD